ncbi:glycoside hydrolase domain-containing protein [Streptomyces sp. NRRL B-24484]|uniref:glycoside hydrolase domain-containing protein n=1 Tax=Streptomyces sp. NRRL B-24484 TaxID=1463833 RepID=UPI000ACC6A87|nr:glycoside hydrolase domain-containing protein [Streptomyces sp. NRRL B-24484]
MPKDRSPRRRTAVLVVVAAAVLSVAVVTTRAEVFGPDDRTVPAAAAPPAAESPAAGTASAPPPTAAASGGTGDRSVFTGLAFDTCTAPALSAMRAWRGTSPYGAAAVYIGGRNRGCAQPQLTPSWVAAVSASGWRLIPLYVGAQPPCRAGGRAERLTAGTAVGLGAEDGADAVAAAGALGMEPGSTLYLDVEAYDAADTACAAAVLAYTRSFDRAVTSRGYRPGFYGFAASGAAVIAQAGADGTPDLPTALWYAKYDGAEDTTASFPFAAGLFTGHRRGHQYRVDRRETYGGVTLTVDRNAWDAPVAVVG